MYWGACYCPYATQDIVLQRDATTLEVMELPIRKWTQDYKEFLETLIKPEDKNAPALIEVLSDFAFLPPPDQDRVIWRRILHAVQDSCSVTLSVMCCSISMHQRFLAWCAQSFTLGERQLSCRCKTFQSICSCRESHQNICVGS